jgi:hypothetical protein
MLCTATNATISISGYSGSKTYEYLSLTIQECNQTLNAACDTSANINTQMTAYLSANDYYEVNFYVIDTILTPTKTVPTTRVL